MRWALVVTTSEATGARLATVAGRSGWRVEAVGTIGAALQRLRSTSADELHGLVVDAGTVPMALAAWFQLENALGGRVAAWVDTTSLGRSARVEAVTAGAAWISTEAALERFLALASARAAGLGAKPSTPPPSRPDSLPPWSPAGIFAGAPVSLMILGTDTRFLYVNSMAAALHGVSAGEHAQRTLGEVLPGMAPALEPLVARVLETGRTVEGAEVVGVTPRSAGKSTRWRVTLFPVHRYGRLDAVGAVVFEAGTRPSLAAGNRLADTTPTLAYAEPPRVLLVAAAPASGAAYATLQAACRLSVVGRADDAIDWLLTGHTCDAVVVDGIDGESSEAVDLVVSLADIAPSLRGRIAFVPADGSIDLRALLEPPAVEGEAVDARTLGHAS